MRLFGCQVCQQLFQFENTRCGQCQHRLSDLPEPNDLVALASDGNDWQPVAAPERRVRFCKNAEHDVCNWLVDLGDGNGFCIACQHNRTVPELLNPENLMAWRKIEWAKHRLFYSLLRLSLPIAKSGDDAEALTFDFLAEHSIPSGPRVMTGHDNGVITIALAEADDAEREKRRTAMGRLTAR